MNYFLLFCVILALGFLGLRYLQSLKRNYQSSSIESKNVITKSDAIKLFNNLKNMPVQFTLLGLEKEKPKKLQDKVLSLGFGNIKDFDGHRGPEWFLLITGAWGIYDIKKDGDNIQLKLICAIEDNTEKIEKDIELLENKKFIDCKISDDLIEFYIGHYELVIPITKESIDACSLALPDESVFQISHSKIILNKKIPN